MDYNTFYKEQRPLLLADPAFKAQYDALDRKDKQAFVHKRVSELLDAETKRNGSPVKKKMPVYKGVKLVPYENAVLPSGESLLWCAVQPQQPREGMDPRIQGTVLEVVEDYFE